MVTAVYRKHGVRRFSPPFITYDELLKDVSLSLGEGDAFSSEERRDFHDFQGRVDPVVELSFDEKKFLQRSKYDARQVHVLVTVASRQRRVSWVAGRYRIDAKPAQVRLRPRQSGHSGWIGTFEVAVRLVFVGGGSKVAPVGQAWKKGQTLARKEFVIGEMSSAPSLQVERATPETLQDLGLPRNALCWFLVDDPEAEDVGTLGRSLLHQDVYDQLENPHILKTPAGQLALQWVFAEMATTLLATVLTDESFEDEVPSSLAKLLEHISTSTGVSEQALVDWFRAGDPRAALAVRAHLDLNVKIKNLLGSGAS